MRCLAIAQAVQDYGVSPVFVCSSLPSELEKRIRSIPADLRRLSSPAGTEEDARETQRLATELSARWIVVDGYHFTEGYLRRIQDESARSVYLDDLGELTLYPTDVLVNQNLYAEEIDYEERFEGQTLIRGPKFTVLRNEFREATPDQDPHPDTASNLLVSVGGSHQPDALTTILRATERLETSLDVRVVGDYPELGRDWETKRTTHEIEFLGRVDRMTDQMGWADIALSAGGTTILELLHLGVPTAAFSIADNQHHVVQAIEEQEVGIGLGNLANLQPDHVADELEAFVESREERERVSERARARVEGLGAERIAAELLDHQLLLRPARPRDRERMRRWTNDPVVREASFDTDEITREEHNAWFPNQLEDEDVQLWIATDRDGRPAGQVRFEPDREDRPEISVSLAQEWRGEGLGSHLIDIATRKFLSRADWRAVHAFIRKDNPRSIRAFEEAGYDQVEETEVNGVPAVLHVHRRSE